MKPLLILNCFFSDPNIWDLFSLITGIFALIISLGFLFRPRIKCCVWIGNNKEGKEQIHVKLFNCNKFRKTLTEIHCEMNISKDFTSTVNTLELRKESIVCLLNVKGKEEHPNYVFITKNYNEYMDDTELKFLKARFLIPNFLGIKKAYEFVEPILALKDKKCISITPKKL
jgi:hypothetical protein